MLTTFDKALAAALGALLPILFARLGTPPEAIVEFSGAISVVLSGFLAWLVPNKPAE